MLVESTLRYLRAVHFLEEDDWDEENEEDAKEQPVVVRHWGKQAEAFEKSESNKQVGLRYMYADASIDEESGWPTGKTPCPTLASRYWTAFRVRSRAIDEERLNKSS